MHTLDYVILVVLAAGLLRGFSTGVIRQVANVVGLVLSFVAAVSLMEPVGDLMVDSLGVSDRLSPILSFVAVLLAIQVVLFAAIRLAESVVGVLKLTTVNRLLGGAVGALKAALLLSVLFIVLQFFGVPGQEARADSELYGPIASALPDTWDFLSERLPEARRFSERFHGRVGAAFPASGD